MTALLPILIERIEQNGPISVDEYMSLCLGHPEHGYYMGRDPFGQEGDFITAPEVSQMFGEMLAAFYVDAWHKHGAPSEFHLIEFGPGRGTLMSDILRTMNKIAPDMLSAANITLIETSPYLKNMQKEALSDYEVTWADRFEDIDTKHPVFIVMNEFFDALPIRQFIHDGKGWHERMIGSKGDTLEWRTAAATDFDLSDIKGEEGDICEVSEATEQIFDGICNVIANNGGVMLSIDYGHGQAYAVGDTLQALFNGAYDDVLGHPGEADITAHVNFGRLQNIPVKNGLYAADIIQQGMFLQKLGIEHRARQLAHQNLAMAEKIETDLMRFISPDEMGQLFKVMCVADQKRDYAGFV